MGDGCGVTLLYHPHPKLCKDRELEEGWGGRMIQSIVWSWTLEAMPVLKLLL